MENNLETLRQREAKLVEQINSITKWAGLRFCVAERLELKEVREQIAKLKV